MIDTVADFAQASGKLRSEQIIIEQKGIEDRTCLAIVPQFIVTAKP